MQRRTTSSCCNGYGDILRKPFSVKNSPEGVEYLTQQVVRSCRHRAINHKHVFFGGEDPNSYAENFVNALRSQGWLIASVNARDAKKQRANLQASTDRLDLLGIAVMLLNRRANCSPAQSGVYRNLRTLVRHRRKLVVMRTEVSNRIHTVVDRLFPGFLNERNTGICPFRRSSLWLMQNRFSARQIRRRNRAKLIEALRRYGTSEPGKAASKLQQYAAQVLSTPPEYIGTLQLSLTQHVKHYRCLQENIDQAVKEIALWLAQTQGAFLTTVRGIGIVLAAGVTAEIGDTNEQKPVNNLVSYSGIIPRVKQSGGSEGKIYVGHVAKRCNRIGSEGKIYVGHVAKRCNRILKNYVVSSAVHLGFHGPPDLMADFKRRDAAGQHAEFGIARRYLRMAMCLMRTSQVYTPERASYYLTMWPALCEKWKKLGALEAALAQDRPLGQWRDMVQQLYEIKLTL
ncbi:MAG: transposase [Deltaproteobacteria bacterium]|nr:transposase [Deltaproteobacteria bacterium]